MTILASRLSGLALIIGALLLGTAIVALSFNPVVNQVFPAFVNWLFMLGSILLLLALPAMYARQAHASGWLGTGGARAAASRDGAAGGGGGPAAAVPGA